jgi:hypothetical protein
VYFSSHERKNYNYAETALWALNAWNHESHVAFAEAHGWPPADDFPAEVSENWRDRFAELMHQKKVPEGNRIQLYEEIRQAMWENLVNPLTPDYVAGQVSKDLLRASRLIKPLQDHGMGSDFMPVYAEKVYELYALIRDIRMKAEIQSLALGRHTFCSDMVRRIEPSMILRGVQSETRFTADPTDVGPPVTSPGAYGLHGTSLHQIAETCASETERLSKTANVGKMESAVWLIKESLVRACGNDSIIGSQNSRAAGSESLCE